MGSNRSIDIFFQFHSSLQSHRSGSHRDLSWFTWKFYRMRSIFKRFHQKTFPTAFQNPFPVHMKDEWKCIWVKCLKFRKLNGCRPFNAYTIYTDASDLAMIYCPGFVTDEFRIHKFFIDFFSRLFRFAIVFCCQLGHVF